MSSLTAKDIDQRMNILFTCAGRRNYLAGYFRDAADAPINIIGADMDPLAPALQECDVAYIVPSVFAPDYIDRIIDICAAERIDVIISLNDHELPMMASERDRIEKTGAKVLVSSSEVIDLCFDKMRSAEWVTSLGLNSPRTETSVEIVKAALAKGELDFPLIVKPRWGSASIAVLPVHSLEELDAAMILVRSQLTRAGLMPKAATGQSDDDPELSPVIIQQMIQGREYGMDVLNDLEGKTQSIYVKEKMGMRSGETDRACLRDSPELTQIGRQLGAALGHIGNMDCDILVENDVAYVLELNPRFGGGYPFTQSAGGDFPGAIMSWLEGKPADIESFGRKYDTVYSKADKIIECKPRGMDVAEAFRKRAEG